MKWIWTATLGMTLITTPRASWANPESLIATSRTDTLTFASVSKRVGVGSKIRVYATANPDRALQLRGADLIPTGFRMRQLEHPSEGAVGSPTLTWTEVREVKVKRNAAQIGGIVGAVLCGGAAAAIGIAIERDEFLNPDKAINAELVFVGTILSATAGGLVGAGIGSLIPKWKTVHPAKSWEWREP